MTAPVPMRPARTLHLAASLSLPTDAVTQTFAILGKRGSGKTTTATVLTEELLEAGQPVVVIDPLDVTWGLRSSRDGKQAGYPITVLGGDHADLPLEAGAGAVLAEFVVESHAPVILSLRHFSLNDQRRFVTDFAERLYVLKGKQTNRAALHLVIDEVDEFAHQRIPAGHERLFGAIDRLVRRGRSAGIGVTMISQRPAVIHKDILSQAEVLICHQTISPQDRKALESWIEAHDAHGQRGEFMATLASLQRGEAWVWSPGWLDVFKRVTVRDRRTFDSSSTPKAGEQPATPKQLAPVDLRQLETRMAATIERAKADDPRELKRLLVQASRDLADRDKRISHLQSMSEAASGFSSSSEKAKPEVRPILTDADHTLLQALREEFGAFTEAIADRADATLTSLAERAHAEIDATFQRWTDHTEKRRALFLERLGQIRVQAVLEKLTTITPTTTTATVPRSSLAGRVAPALAQATSSRPARQVSHGPSDPAVKGGKFKALMIALAQAGRPLSDSQLAARAVMALSGTFDTYLGQMRQHGWIEGTRQALAITTAGLEALGDYEELPTGAELRQHWLAQVSGGKERALLQALFDAYPNALTAAALATAADMALSGTFDTYIGHLRRLQLVEGPRAALRANPELFEP